MSEHDNIVLLMAKAHRDARIDPRVKGTDPDETWSLTEEWDRRKEIVCMDTALAALRDAGYAIVRVAQTTRPPLQIEE